MDHHVEYLCGLFDTVTTQRYTRTFEMHTGILVIVFRNVKRDFKRNSLLV
jgi:hypothetical protein